MKQLTRAEEEIMQVLWQKQKAFVKDIIAEMPEPKPHYNTISTLIKILVEKGFVNYTAYGKSYEYYPVVDKDEYSQKTLKKFASKYFEGSFRNMVSFFVREKDLSVKELEDLLEQIKKAKK